jgi:hypothetical protein
MPKNELLPEIDSEMGNNPETELSPEIDLETEKLPVTEVAEVPEFVPVKIYTDGKKVKSIRNRYETLIGDLNCFCSEFKHLMDETDQITLEKLIEFLSCESPEMFLKIAFIEKNEIHFPGLNTRKIVELNLFDLPDGFHEDVRQATISYNNLWQSILHCRESGFEYPLLQMYFQDNEGNIFFDLDNSFDKKLEDFCTLFTLCEAQNKLLPVYSRFIDCLNELNSMDESLLTFEHGRLEFLKLSQFVDVSRDKDVIVCLDHMRFWAYYRSRNNMGQRIYNFPAKFPGLFKDFPEPDRYKIH